MAKSAMRAVSLAIAVCCIASGCASSGGHVCATYPQQPYRDILVVVPGTGNSPALETNVRQLVVAEHLPLYVEPFAWTHGNGRYVIDQIDYNNIRCKGLDLAARIGAYRQMCPDAK